MRQICACSCASERALRPAMVALHAPRALVSLSDSYSEGGQQDCARALVNLAANLDVGAKRTSSSSTRTSRTAA